MSSWKCVNHKRSGIRKMGVCGKDNCDGCRANSFASNPKHMCLEFKEDRENAYKIPKSSTKVKYSFICDLCGNNFSTTTNHVNAGHWCDTNCLKRRTSVKKFDSHEKAKYWSSNNEKKADFYTMFSNFKAKFDCPDCKEEFSKSIKSVSNGGWCPCCKNKDRKITISKDDSWYCSTLMKNRTRDVCGDKDCKGCFKNSLASHPNSKYYSSNNIKPVYHFSLGAKFDAEFICSKGHVFTKRISNVAKGSWCDECLSFKRSNEVDELFMKRWSLKNNVDPKSLNKSSNQLVWIKCDTCNHEDIMSFNIALQCNNCVYCINQKLCKDLSCEYCKEKSFVNNPMYHKYSKKNKLDARFVFKNSPRRIYLDCDVCNHTYFVKAEQSTKRGCSYCAHRKLCDEPDCTFCFNNSFASHPRAKYWLDKNEAKPRNVFKSAKFSAHFHCPDCKNDIEQTLDNIISGYGCNICVNKTEKKLLNWLKVNYPSENIVTQQRFKWCKNIKTLPFDFYFKRKKLVIELDGIQHFEQVMNWAPPEEVQKRDKIKDESCQKKGFKLIRIRQEDVYKDINDWETNLTTEINSWLNK